MAYAGFWRRFIAFFIDGLILMVPSLMFGSAIQDIYFGLGINFILSFLYYPIFESSFLQGTPGKALMGLKVQSEETGDILTFRAAVIRFFCKYISIMTIYIGYLIQPFTKRRQTLHDILSEAVVVKSEPIDVNYFKVWKVQFQKIVASL